MLDNSLPASGEIAHLALESSSPFPELQFDGFGARSDAASTEKTRGNATRVAEIYGAQYKSMSPAKLPISRSPQLTIPSGFSPSVLLESPVLLTNIKAEPSPTTGTFSMPFMVKGLANSSLSPPGEQSNSTHGDGHSGSFEFQLNIQSGSSSLAPLVSAGSRQQEYDTCGQVLSQSVVQLLECSQSVKAEGCAFSAHELTLTVAETRPPAEAACSNLQEAVGSDHGVTLLQPDNKGSSVSAVPEKLSNDGYNWRKYGQKHVKGCEFPRSYYKCTHPNCQMKKQLERSHNGQITEVIYKGHHDHPKPQPSHRVAIGEILAGYGEEKTERFSSLVNAEDKLLNANGQGSHHVDPNGNPELSPVSASDDDADGGGRLNSTGDEGVDGDDPESKRRKQDTNVTDAMQIGKVNREPRVVVQTVSEVDILDDGYRWRKYGQKVVKGNPNPRSYYKCTNVGCPVRKHVERASHDPKAVITTYEGKHNHDVPVSRNSSHDTIVAPAEDGANTLNGCMAVALNGMLRTCDIKSIPHHYNQSDEMDTISLDLGVGISPRHRSSKENQRTPQPEHAQSHQLQIPLVDQNDFSTTSFYPISYHSLHGSRENKGDGFTFSAPINHPPNQYYSKAGNLVMGP
ncbi:WRKY domain-containing protein [Dioscorea alata]|uniref:WRKY domain-containing protein n=2 Tax=Dioscorea alata TaxID=55571 RepID=A0ACB7U0R6_DIOAL|nr:WRKY domain-containing protein [Dioscorea alata]